MGRFALMVVLCTACSFDASAPETDKLLGGPSAPDAAPPDATPPDATPLSCTDKYGAASDFDLCESTPTSCRFYVRTNADTCTNLCASFGGSCLESYNGDCANKDVVRDCEAVLTDQVCICSR